MVIWVIGRSGAGKSTLASVLAEELRRCGTPTVLIDGDEVRSVFQAEGPADYTLAGRRRNAERLHLLSGWLERQGVAVVCAALLIFQEVADLNRAKFEAYLEVQLVVPGSDVENRDVKGLYQRARAGVEPNVVGVDIEYTPPSGSDLMIDTSGPEPDWAQLAVLIMAHGADR